MAVSSMEDSELVETFEQFDLRTTDKTDAELLTEWRTVQSVKIEMNRRGLF